ncbi:hypothetical protein LIER_18761 [Lithospermum erythrorhizon]|uniref:Uncharacterized protein n=1 Tax=Lithospermum erythrorhizon TaxID=34254 RepID=A0AAV3QHR9_LITER
MGDGKSIMSRDEARKVLAIPLSRQRIHDRVIWNHTKSGHYLTCSGYISAREMKLNGAQCQCLSCSGWIGIRVKGRITRVGSRERLSGTSPRSSGRDCSTGGD